MKITPEHQLKAAQELRRRAELLTIPHEKQAILSAAKILETLAKHKCQPKAS
jgi:hypothetical protein